jgi:hypothetical protein
VIVIADKTGQLGNRLFQFAHIVAFAAEHGIRVANPGFEDYAAHFPAFAADPLCRWPTPRFPLPAGNRMRRSVFRQTDRLLTVLRRTGRPLGLLDYVEPGPPGSRSALDGSEFLSRARRRGILLVTGWGVRDDRSFDLHADLLREVFQPAPRHTDVAQACVSAARRCCDVLAGLHARRGDYASYEGGRFFWSADQYVRIVAAIRNLYPGRRVGVLACSDDAQLLRELSGAVAPGPGNMISDLMALSLCDLIVGPPSTFSAWAAFHGGVPFRHVERSDETLTLQGFRTRGPRSPRPPSSDR